MKNLSDFLTREGLPPGDIEKLNLKNTQILDFVDHLPNEEFTLKRMGTMVCRQPTISDCDRHEDGHRHADQSRQSNQLRE